VGTAVDGGDAVREDQWTGLRARLP
jgi:hypothetical protein